jgi:hypothetical protein
MKFIYVRHMKSLDFQICLNVRLWPPGLGHHTVCRLLTFRRKLLTPYSGQKRVELEYGKLRGVEVSGQGETRSLAN